MLGRAGPRGAGRDAGVAAPEAGVEAREAEPLPLTPFVAIDAGFLPQAGATAAWARGLTGPRAGKASSEAVLSGALVAFLVAPSAFCFPAAFSLRGAAALSVVSDWRAAEEGGGWATSSSSTTSSTVAWWSCCCINCWAGVRPSPELLVATASDAIVCKSKPFDLAKA